MSEIFGLSDGPAKHEYRSGRLQKWLAKVHNVKLGDITPSKVHAWKRGPFWSKPGADQLTPMSRVVENRETGPAAPPVRERVRLG